MRHSLRRIAQNAPWIAACGLLLGGCPLYLEDYEDDTWWDEECPDSPAPPPYSECSENADCGEGSCQQGTCVDLPPTSCTYHADCPVGFACDEALCEPTSICSEDDDCWDDHVCDARHSCVPPEDGRCRDDEACGEDAQCVMGACQSVDEDVCQFDNDCGVGRACVDRACTPLCERHGDCPSGTRCSDGVCEAKSGNECVLSSECEEGPCVDGHCATRCEDDDGCREGIEVCGDDGLCQPDAAPRAFCEGDDECAEGHVCVDGVCRTPCPELTDAECLRFDSQLPMCAENGLCYSRTEFDPECASSADCDDGQRCMNAICRN